MQTSKESVHTRVNVGLLSVCFNRPVLLGNEVSFKKHSVGFANIAEAEPYMATCKVSGHNLNWLVGFLSVLIKNVFILDRNC